MHNLRIALIVPDYHRHGGHARYVAELAKIFKSEHEVHVYTSVWEEHDPEGIIFHKLPAVRWTALTAIVSFFIPASLIPVSNYDIVHAQGFCGLRQNIITAHICNKAWYEAAERYGNQLSWKKKINKFILTCLENLPFRKGGAKVFIAVSSKLKTDLISKHSIPEDLIQVIHHGIDHDTFNVKDKEKIRTKIRANIGVDSNEIVFLYVGDWQKAGQPLAKAMAKIRSGKLLIVTKTNPKIVIHDLSKFGSIKNVILLAPTKEIENYYKSADIFVFPSYYDSFGMVVTEAMACGLPVITNKNVGAAEIILNGVNGILVDDCWDSDQLAKAMMRLAGDRNLLKEMSESCRSSVKSLTWEKCARETMIIYENVLKASRKQSKET